MLRLTQTGQALTLGLALVAITVLTLSILFNTGQAAAEKAKIANTADAAAYSAMLWQARALNFQAYTNRAMVANQVAIAQAVSLRSWALYGSTTTQNINTVLQGVPIVGQITQAMETAMEVAQRIISR